MKIGVNLCWLKVGKCGGTETLTRNILNGFAQYAPNDNIVLFVAKDNEYSFKHYLNYPNFEIIVCGAESEKPLKRLVWEGFFLDKAVRKSGVDIMFNPVYSKPLTWGNKLPYVTCIADLQAYHYPQYFSGYMRFMLKCLWKYACKSSVQIIAISGFVKDDIESRFPAARGKCSVVYSPVETKASTIDFEEVSQKYGIESQKYWYCVSSLLPHKNLETMLKMLSELKKRGIKQTVMLSGISDNSKQFEALCKEYDVEDCICRTGYISNEVRDCLYDNCELFIFPSVFEGFGLPPIEAMRRGKRVVMTKKTCLWEVTEGKASYVENPLDELEWIERIEEARKKPEIAISYPQYELENITADYLKIFQKCIEQKKTK